MSLCKRDVVKRTVTDVTGYNMILVLFCTLLFMKISIFICYCGVLMHELIIKQKYIGIRHHNL